jgi:hypothetical protein
VIPTKSILDKTFRYVPAARTNIRERFARIRFEQQVAKLKALRSLTIHRIK